jgi:PhnB protein
MSTLNIPEKHQAVMPYLILPGAAKFLDFTKKVFDAEETALYKRDKEEGIMHAEVMIGNSTIMFADSTEQWKPQTACLYVYVKNADEVYAKAIAEGAITVMEPADKDYGRTCGVNDPLGNTWWITSL